MDALLARRGSCDNILIVKGGYLSDSHSANIILFDGKRFYTPARPLLRGTKRAYLIAKGLAFEADLAPASLGEFREIHIVNAFLDPGTAWCRWIKSGNNSVVSRRVRRGAENAERICGWIGILVVYIHTDLRISEFYLSY